MFADDSDLEDLDNSKLPKTSDDNKKQNHSEIEKRRRDKMNTYITELSGIVPMCHTMSRKLDKLTVLRMAVQHLKSIRGALHSYSEGHYKSSFFSDQELKQLILQAADGFLVVVGCDRGKILYVSESISQVLKFQKEDVLGHSFFDILHPKDVMKVKEQLSSSDVHPREKLIDAKTMLPLKTDVIQGSSKLCTGAKRSFFCRIKYKAMSQVKEEADTTTGFQHQKKMQNFDKKYSLIHCTGFLRTWPLGKLNLQDQETDEDEMCNMSCLIAIGRNLRQISTICAQNQFTIYPLQFMSRHTLDGKFLYVDQRATLALGFLQQELLGSSMYEYYHQDEITAIAECHKYVLQNCGQCSRKIYRFKTKEGGFVQLQSEWKALKNPWTQDLEYLVAKNTLMLTNLGTVDSSENKTENTNKKFDFFSHCNQDIQKLINTHVEASKIGRQIAEQVKNAQKNKMDFFSRRSSSSDGETLTSTKKIFVRSKQSELPQAFPKSSKNPAPEPAVERMEESSREQSKEETITEGNDEAAMAVIMSLLEADAGLGGPVDFSGLPWPLP